MINENVSSQKIQLSDAKCLPKRQEQPCLFFRYDLAVEMNNQGHKKYLAVDFDDAIADYTRALDLCPTLAVAYYNRGTVLYRLGELPAALRDLKSAVHLEPTNSAFREGLMECQRLMHELGTSSKQGEAVVVQNPPVQLR